MLYDSSHHCLPASVRRSNGIQLSASYPCWLQRTPCQLVHHAIIRQQCRSLGYHHTHGRSAANGATAFNMLSTAMGRQNGRQHAGGGLQRLVMLQLLPQGCSLDNYMNCN